MIDPRDLQAAVEAGVIDAPTRDRLAAFLTTRASAAPPGLPIAPKPAFDVVHVLWYAGALIVMSGMGLFSTLAFAALGGYALTATAIIYAAGFWALGHYLWNAKGLRVPGGLAIAVAVSMAPLAIYGVEDAFNLWSFGAPGAYRSFYTLINGGWLFMEVGAIIASAVALRFYPFPFILLIAAIALWFMSMDIVRWLESGEKFDDWELRRKVSIVFGLLMVGVGWVLDLKWARRGDFGFWIHLFGALTLWSGISWAGESTEFTRALYCAINVVFIFFGVFLKRRIYAVLGAIGVAGYLGYLSYEVFDNVYLFSFALSAIGLALIFLGIAFQKNQQRINAAIERSTPATLRALRPERALAS